MIVQVIDPHRKDLGGFQVGRVLPAAFRRMVGPFAFFDHMGPARFVAGLPLSADVRPHPHIGLSTLTYLFAGQIMHRDSLGTVQPIEAGAVNWMTAGSGITHSERFERARLHGDTLHGIQAWIALPKAQEETHPAFTHHAPEDLPLFDANGLTARLIAGRAFGAESPVPVHSPLFYIHWHLAAGATAALPAEYPERAAYIAMGEVEVAGHTYPSGKMLILASGETVTFTATQPSTLLLLGGEPLGPRYLEWNFVSSRRERIEQAKADWRAGRMKLPDADNQEFIPLPDENRSEGDSFS